jgi:hypothetical protein
MTLATQTLQILRDPLADRVFFQLLKVVQIQNGFVGARQKARGSIRVHA